MRTPRSLTRSMGRRSIQGLVALSEQTDEDRVIDLSTPRPSTMGIFCLQCGKEQSRPVCNSCSPDGMAD